MTATSGLSSGHLTGPDLRVTRFTTKALRTLSCTKNNVNTFLATKAQRKMQRNTAKEYQLEVPN